MTMLKFHNDPFIATINEVLENVFNPNVPTAKGNAKFTRMRTPGVNIIENDDVFKLEVAAPGLNKEDFNVQLEDGLLSIEAKAEIAEEETKENYTRKEFNFSTFKRSFNLPETADSENITATYINGILTVSIAKVTEEEIEPKVISVS